ncbi:uncharacterized protein B0H18DRAFT_1115538 [Fomitopsis serialis]|uniref:uncharacterized protein n=1 Tax=Fomitopsis serialis TaxID=139415 RepID=UPI0020089116|nr:uncharacterized protein B0H18DRAFT_1127246 [Neoantrodia serialis]XP_047897519.1 uncharacterized protein B0H18DRAFT_1115538 [Neoantrodia serialis]KAH9912380.1 hypothetical protein B0H18DRAFT_1127246 [Neoantrodia serialis]KAH9932884.1 hypothetical protein B0H18DRAFT_1115538 [Neoantrodia serialis]
MERAPPQQKRMMLAVAGAVALGAAGIYYSRPSGLAPKTAAQNDLKSSDKKVDANPTAQHNIGDVRENAK